MAAAAASDAPSALSSIYNGYPNVKPKPYHAYKWLHVSHPKYGPMGKWVPFFVEQLVTQPPTSFNNSRNVPCMYHLIDPEQKIDALVHVDLATPFSGMRTPFGVNKSDPTKFGGKVTDKPKWSIGTEFNERDPSPEEVAYRQMNDDYDAWWMNECRAKADLWWPNVRPIVKLGAIEVSKVDYLQGMFKAVNRARESPSKDNPSMMKTYPPRMDHNIATKQDGTFKDLRTFGSDKRTPIDPLTIGRDATVVVIHRRGSAYLMEKQWGPRLQAMQIIKLADGATPVDCMLPPDEPVPMQDGAYGWGGGDA